MTWSKQDTGEGYPMMPYNPQTTLPGAMQRPVMAPLYLPSNPMVSMPMASMPYPSYEAPIPFPTCESYALSPPASSPTAALSPYRHQYQERPQMQHMPSPGHGEYRGYSHTQHAHCSPADHKESHHLKSDVLPVRMKSVPQTIRPILPVPGAQETKSDTPLDILMRKIQSKPDTDVIIQKNETAKLEEEQRYGEASPVSRGPDPEKNARQSTRSKRKPKKVYKCDFPGCEKVCGQRGQLRTHQRSHTGEKTVYCTYEGCGRGFSQVGNLNTHIRRHTGEKPFSCPLCDRGFPQRGNLRSHQATHLKLKPFECLFDGCDKRFTARGNLKKHQEKFHIKTIEELMVRFSAITDWASASEEDRKWVDYLAPLYKNLNKGIKGRGKGTIITPVSSTPVSPEPFVGSSPHMPPHPFSGPFHGVPYQPTYNIGPPGYAGPQGLPMNGAYNPYDMASASPVSPVSSPVSTASGTTYASEEQDRAMGYGQRFWN